jgi:hypothetical protein
LQLIARNILFVHAQNAKATYCYKNENEKLLKTNAAIWINKICEINQLTPKYVNIKEYGNNLQQKGDRQIYPE